MMRKFCLILAAAILASSFAHAADYLPPPGDAWATRKPRQEGFDADKLKAAIDFAIANEPKFPP